MAFLLFMRYVIGLCIVLLYCDFASGQQNPYDYYLNDGLSTQEYVLEIIPETELFYAPLAGSDDLFTRMSNFNFSMVRYARRGYDAGLSGVYVNGIDLNDGLSVYPDYDLMSNLSRMRFRSTLSIGASCPTLTTGLVGETEEFDIMAADIPMGHSISAFSSDRRYRLGTRIQSAGTIGRKWNYAVSLMRRWGRDATIQGVFTDETSWLVAVDRELAPEHTLTFLAAGTAVEKGLRSAATREAYSLTGDPYYNPSWGYYDGKVRNSRVSKRLRPFMLLTYNGVLSTTTRVTASSVFQFGKDSYGTLAWYDAQTPYPDYYRYMPSYVDHPLAEEMVTEGWRRGDPTVIGIDWASLCEQNQMSDHGAVYVLEDRVKDARTFQATVTFRTNVDRHTSLVYGARWKANSSHNYKLMKDLLSGSPVVDVDCYLINDEFYGDLLLNNVREPDRKIVVGDRFGYDYTLSFGEYKGFLLVNYADNRFRFSCGADIAQNQLQRRGHYEKELYPGNLSFGKSERLVFNPYTVQMAAGYSFSPKHRVEVAALAAKRAPFYGNVFLSPDYTNCTIESPVCYGVLSADAGYSVVTNRLKGKLSLYVTRTDHETDIYRYYDDLAGVYVDMSLDRVAKMYYGGEMSLRYDLSSRLSLGVAGAIGHSVYDSDPTVRIVDDATRRVIVEGAKSRLKGYRCTISPERVCSGEVRYSNHGWLVTLTYSYAGERYVAATPLRRMARAYNLAASPEEFAHVVSQEKLEAASTVDLFVYKSFMIRGVNRLSASFSIHNLLDNRDMIYNGYEQMRMISRGNGANVRWMPFDSKYQYAYGRGYYVAVTYKF